MTEPVDPHETLYVTDAELIRRLGVPEKIMRDALRMFDDGKVKGFPKKQPLFGNRRYWPAVRAYMDRMNNMPVAQQENRRSA